MKKYLLFIMLGCFFISCSKDNKSTTPPPHKTGTGKTYAVKFNVSASTLTTKTTNSLRADSVTSNGPLSTVANMLYYYVYDSGGHLVTRLVQDSTASNFGQITDTFSPGTYNIVLVSYKVTSQNIFTPLGVPGIYSTDAFNAQGFDSFYKNFSITVADSAVTQNVTLNRVVGQLQVQLTDSIPVGTTSIEVDVVSDLDISFSTGLPNTTANTLKVIVPVPAAAIGKPNFTITTYVGNTSSDFTVNLSAANASGVFATASATNVTCQKNTRTLLTGALFAPPASTQAFTVTFDKSWSNPITIDF